MSFFSGVFSQSGFFWKEKLDLIKIFFGKNQWWLKVEQFEFF
jgi:hypothetical protein